MLAQGLGLKVSFLWFQRLESNGRQLQKSNASLQERQLEKLKARGNLGSNQAKSGLMQCPPARGITLPLAVEQVVGYDQVHPLASA